MVNVDLNLEQYRVYLLSMDHDKKLLSNDSFWENFWWGLSFSAIINYFCGFLILIGLLIFFKIGSKKYGNSFMINASACYMLLFQQMGDYVWHTCQAQTLAGIILSLSLLMIIPAISGLNNVNYFNDDIDVLTRIQISIGMIIFAGYLIWNYPGFQFFVTFIGSSILDFSVDILCLITNQSRLDYIHVRRVSEAFGLLMVSLAWKLQKNYQSGQINTDYSYWLYFWGVTSFWCALACEKHNSKIRTFCYGLINFGFILIWTKIAHGIFLFYGVIGILGYQIISWNRSYNREAFYIFSYDLAILSTAYYLDQTEIITPFIDLSFWLYLFGASATWVDISNKIDLNVPSELQWFLFLMFNLGYIIISLLTTRFIFFFWGLLGVGIYIYIIIFHLFNNIFLFAIFLIIFSILSMGVVHLTF